MTVGMKYMTARTCILIGALLLAIFYVVTAFVENFGVLYFTVGFITGDFYSFTLRKHVRAIYCNISQL